MLRAEPANQRALWFSGSVGAGDSMVAGFVYEYLKKGDVKAAYKMAAACGSATAYSKHLAKKDMIEELSNQIEIGE